MATVCSARYGSCLRSPPCPGPVRHAASRPGPACSAARPTVAEQGIEGASVDAIAERAQRTSGSLYGQFGSKDGLIVALLDESKDLVAESMLADMEAASSLDEWLAALWRNFSRPPAAARDWVQFEHEVWVWATRPGNDAARARLGERYRGEFATLAVALDAWAAEGLIDCRVTPQAWPR